MKPSWFLKIVWENFVVNNLRFLYVIVKGPKSNIFTCQLCAWVIFMSYFCVITRIPSRTNHERGQSPKLGKNEIPRLLANRRSVGGFDDRTGHTSRCERNFNGTSRLRLLHLARWIGVRNNSEIKEMNVSLISWDPCASCLLEFTFQKIQLAWKPWEPISGVWPSENFPPR